MFSLRSFRRARYLHLSLFELCFYKLRLPVRSCQKGGYNSVFPSHVSLVESTHHHLNTRIFLFLYPVRLPGVWSFSYGCCLSPMSALNDLSRDALNSAVAYDIQLYGSPILYNHAVFLDTTISRLILKFISDLGQSFASVILDSMGVISMTLS